MACVIHRCRRALVLAACLAAVVAITDGPGGSAQAASTLPKRLQNPLEVRTKPAVAGISFTFNGETFVTDSQGRFVIPTSLLPPEIAVPKVGFTVIVDRLHLLPNRSADGKVYQLERLYQRFHTIERGNRSRVVYAALDAYVPVRFALLDRLGEPVDPGLFQSMTIKRSDGAVFRLDRKRMYGGPVVFRSSRVVPLTGGLVSKPLDYRIQSVIVGGNNVVNRAQQAFTPLLERHVRVRVLFYTARISARDRIFGFGIGSGIRLEFPNGTVDRVSFTGGHRLTLSALPRGTYRVSVDSWGLSGGQPLAITRDQVVELKVLSYLDIAVLVGALLAIAVGLVVVGRAPLRRATARPPKVAPAPVEVSEATPTAPVVLPVPEAPRERPRSPRRATVGRPPPLPQFPPRRGNR